MESSRSWTCWTPRVYRRICRCTSPQRASCANWRCEAVTHMLIRHLQDFLLYAIVLCDSAQRSAGSDHSTASHSRSDSGAASAARSAPPLSQPAAHVEARRRAGSQQSVDHHSQHSASALVTAAEARRALRLYTASTGKYAAGGSAFMAPVYGVGELPQVRMTAVERLARTALTEAQNFLGA